MEIGGTLAYHARNDPDGTALVFEGERLSWSTLNDRANRVGNALSDLGVSRGDHVMLLLENSIEFVESYYGLAKIGCTSAPLMPSLMAREVGEIAESLQVEYVIAGADAADLVTEIDDHLSARTEAIGTGTEHGLSHDYASIVAGASTDAPPIDVHADDPLSIKFTGGTTGTPKGCVRTHRNFLMAGLISLVEIPLVDDDVSIISTPLAAGMAVSLLTRNVLRGVTTVLLPEFDPGAFLGTIEREGVTLCTVMETMARRLVDHPAFEGSDLSSLRLLSGITSRDLLDAFGSQETFDADFSAFYGSSEAGGQIIFKKPSDFQRELTDPAFEHRLESLGREAMLTRVEVLDDDQDPVPTGEIGELAVRGPSVFQRYWERPEETAAVFEDGWLLTGDLVYRDEAGYIYLCGRKDDMIQSGGINVYPAEIEPVLQSHDDVLDAVVVGVPDPDWGERVVGCVVPSGDLHRDDLAAHCREHLSKYKRPKEFVVLDSLPKNDAGKVLKRELVDQLVDGASP